MDAKNQAEVLNDPSVTPIVPNNWVNNIEYLFFKNDII